MSCNQSFTENTEAVTHDSDPRRLSFNEVEIDPSLQNGEGIVINHLGSALDLHILGRTSSLGPYPTFNFGAWSLGGGGSTHFVINFTDLTSLAFDISAATLYSLAVAQGFTTVHGATFSLASYAPASLTPYVGKTIDSIYSQVTSTYFSAISGQIDAGPASDIYIRYAPYNFAGPPNLTVSGSPTIAGPGLAVPVIGGTHLEIGMIVSTTPGDLYPTGIPSLFMTEPYEVRQRNLPAFKLLFTGSTSETPPNIKIGCVVSQGDPNTQDNNFGREWCPTPLDILAASGPSLDVAYPATISTGQQLTDLPANYCGCALLLPKEYGGPWNYIKFVIMSSSGSIDPALAGITLQITANAREL